MKYIIALLLLVSTAYPAGVDTCKSTNYVEDTYINKGFTTLNWGGKTFLRLYENASAADSTRIMYGVKNFNTWASSIGSGRVLDTIAVAMYCYARTTNSASDSIWWGALTFKLKRFFREGNNDSTLLTGSDPSGMTWAKYKDSNGTGQDSSWSTAGAGSSVNDYTAGNYDMGYTPQGLWPAVNNWVTINLTNAIRADENSHFRSSIGTLGGRIDTALVYSSEYATDASKSLRFWVYWHMTGYRYCDNRATNAYKDRRY